MTDMPAPPPGASSDAPTFGVKPLARKRIWSWVLPLIAACLVVGGVVGWTLVPAGQDSPLQVMHARAVAGCIPTQLSILAPVAPELARRTADAQIQAARAQGFTNGGYLVTETRAGTVITLYVEDCRGA